MLYPLLFFFFTEPFTGHSMVSKSCMVSLSTATQHRKKNSRTSRSTLTTSATVCLTESAGMQESSTTKSASKVPAATPKTRHYVNLVSQSQCFHVVFFFSVASRSLSSVLVEKGLVIIPPQDDLPRQMVSEVKFLCQV